MYAIFENGNKQYRVSEGDTVKLEKLKANVGDTVAFPAIMVADDKGIKVGAEAEGTSVTAQVLCQGKAKKIIVFRYKPKKNVRKKQGHRQPYTEVKVTAIGKAEKTAAAKPAKAATAAKPETAATATKTATTAKAATSAKTAATAAKAAKTATATKTATAAKTATAKKSGRE